MTAMGIEIQNRCEAIKQNYTSIFDDRSNHFWVVVPLTIFAAATAQTSLVPLLFIASMFSWTAYEQRRSAATSISFM